MTLESHIGLKTFLEKRSDFKTHTIESQTGTLVTIQKIKFEGVLL